jgi:hypothetical protein
MPKILLGEEIWNKKNKKYATTSHNKR